MLGGEPSTKMECDLGPVIGEYRHVKLSQVKKPVGLSLRTALGIIASVTAFSGAFGLVLAYLMEKFSWSLSTL